MFVPFAEMFHFLNFLLSIVKGHTVLALGSSRNCLHKILAFWDHWSQLPQSKLVLKLLQSLCRTRCCIFNAVLAGGLIKYLCLFQSSNAVLTLAEWLSALLSPLGKLSCAEWMLPTESHWWRSTIHHTQDGEKPGPLNEHLKWGMYVADGHKSQNECWPNFFFVTTIMSII